MEEETVAKEAEKLEAWRSVRREAEFAMQMDVYASGSASIVKIEGRARLLENMFMEMIGLQIDVKAMSEWDAALWVRSRVIAGAKTAGATSRTALALAERFTAEPFFAESTLVKSQAFPKIEARAASEPPKQAIAPTMKHVKALEAAIVGGATVQQRVMAK